MSNTIDKVFIVFIFAGFILYYLGLANMIIWMILVVLRLLSCNRIEIGFFSLLYGTSLFGRMFVSPSLYLWSMIVTIVLGVILLWKEIFSSLQKNLHSYVFLLIFLLFFVFEFFIGPRTDYAVDKITRILVRAPIWTMAFFVYVYTNKISNKRMATLFALLAIFYLSQAFEIYGIHPTSFSDVTFFRVQAEILGRNELGTMAVSWHTMGFLALAPILFILSDSTVTRNKFIWALFLLCSFLAIISGARQVIVCLIILALLRYFMSKGDIFTTTNFFKIVLLGGCIYITTLVAENYIMMQTLGDKEKIAVTLNRDTETPYQVMAISPITGIGFGGYPLYANKDYPHNFIIELICEVGIVGLLFLLFLIFLFIITNNNRKYSRYTTRGGAFLFLFLALRFLISLISGDAGSSVSFICVLLTFVPRLTNSASLMKSFKFRKFLTRYFIIDIIRRYEQVHRIH